MSRDEEIKESLEVIGDLFKRLSEEVINLSAMFEVEEEEEDDEYYV